MWNLSDARARHVGENDTWLDCAVDRRELLALVDRLAAALNHLQILLTTDDGLPQDIQAEYLLPIIGKVLEEVPRAALQETER